MELWCCYGILWARMSLLVEVACSYSLGTQAKGFGYERLMIRWPDGQIGDGGGGGTVVLSLSLSLALSLSAALQGLV